MRASRRRRFLVDGAALSTDFVELAAEQAHHLRVMRLRAGETVTLFDGAGVEAIAEVLDASAGTLRVIRRTAAATERLRTCLIQAVPVKVQRMDLIVQQATELGVSRLVPVCSERGQLPGGGLGSLTRRHARWQRIAATAAKQCGRSVLPVIDLPAPMVGCDLQQLPRPHLLLSAGGESMAAAAVADAVSLFVGPEGGWSEAERARLVQEGALPVGLGPRTLRADTAGAAALALAQYLWGDLRTPSDTP